MSDDHWLVGAGALGTLPVCLIDFVAALFLLRVWQRSHDRDPFAALPLALFFAATGMLSLCQTLMMTTVDTRTSFLWNDLGASLAVLSTAPPMLAFADGYLGRSHGRRGPSPIVVIGAVVVVVVASAFAIRWFTTPASDIFYDPHDAHAHRTRLGVLDGLLPIVLLAAHGTSLALLLHKARQRRGRDRCSAIAFAVVIVLAIVCVVVNRVEAIAGALPPGTYATTSLWVTAAALLLFMTHTDEITRFHDRIAALVLVVVLATVSVVAGAAVSRAEQAAVARLGDWRAVRLEVDAVAFPAAVAMVVVTVFVLLVVPTVAEVAVLRPLRRLERADADSRGKSVFLAAMSHELKTPLSAVLHHARELRGHVDVDVATRAGTVASSAEHLLSLIEALLSAGRDDARPGGPPAGVARVAVDVDALVRDLVAAQRDSAQVVVDGAVGSALVDARMLRQIVTNLVGNALRHGGESVVVRVRRREDRLHVVVEDRGPGIPASARAQVFQPFFQLHPGEGVGLGLAIARQLAESLGGSLILDGAVSTGARFVVDVHAPAVGVSSVYVAADAKAADLDVSSTALPAAVRSELLALALVGDVVELRKKASELALADDTRAFAGRLDQLASRCELRALRRLLGDGAGA